MSGDDIEPPYTPTLREARKALVDGLIAALRDRPATFRTYDIGQRPYRLIDDLTGQEWWIANGHWFFKLEPDLKLGGWNRERGWWAVSRWLRKHRNKPAAPHAREAQKIWDANAAYAPVAPTPSTEGTT